MAGDGDRRGVFLSPQEEDKTDICYLFSQWFIPTPPSRLCEYGACLAGRDSALGDIRKVVVIKCRSGMSF